MDTRTRQAVGRLERGRFAGALITLETALVVAAVGGGIALIVSPHDAMSAAVLGRTPFGSWVLPGILLIVTVAAPATIVATGAVARRAYAHVGHPLVGAILIGWITIQLIMIGATSFLQPLIGAWGAVIGVLGAANYRCWQMRWGASDAEYDSSMPGDGLISRAHVAPTRAISIDAPPDAVWPWIVPTGYRRVGWYSDDLLDNGEYHCVEQIRPQLQTVAVGDVVPRTGRVDERSAFRVAALTPAQVLVWAKPDSTWASTLSPTAGGETRLVTRIRARHAGAAALISVPLMDLGDFPMTRWCLYGIKRRAEATAHTAASRPTRVEGAR